MDQKKDSYIRIRVNSETKALAKRLAKEQGRSMSNYIEWLIVQEAKKAQRRVRQSSSAIPDEGQDQS